MKTKKTLTVSVLITVPAWSFAVVTADKIPTPVEVWISFFPVILFLLIITVLSFKLSNDKTKISDLLTEKDLQSAGAVTNPGSTSVPAQSVSRFVAFLTGIVALALSSSISTFYMYGYFCNPATTINLSNLTNVILGLGIGVIPYGFNKISAAMKST